MCLEKSVGCLIELRARRSIKMPKGWWYQLEVRFKNASQYQIALEDVSNWKPGNRSAGLKENPQKR